MQLSYHNIQNMKNQNKSTERSGGNDSSEGNNSHSNENKSQDSKIKGLTGTTEKKPSFLHKGLLGSALGMRVLKPGAKKTGTSKLRTQTSAQLAKKAHKKGILTNPSGHLLAVPLMGGASQILNQQQPS